MEYKYKISDWLPVIGLMNYIQRNGDELIPDEKVVPTIGRDLLLTSYNLAISITGAVCLIHKGLEAFLN